MSDAETTVADLKRLVATFVEERDWAQFHAPKNLAMSVAIEAAELMELFQWESAEESRSKLRDDPKFRQRVEEEMSDVLSYLLSLAHHNGIDLSRALVEKMARNAEKYPASVIRGRARLDSGPRAADGPAAGG